MIEWMYVATILTVVIGGFFIRSLSVSGAITAFFVGISVAIGFGWKGMALLGIFFLSSSLWSKFQRDRKTKIMETVEKGEQRDYLQVLANGSVPSLISILYYYFPSTVWIELFIVSLAAANADTWASEIGSLSKPPPRLITTWKVVPPGTSGAVTLLGTTAALGGAFSIGIIGFVLWGSINIVYVSLFGFLGSVIDTILGVLCQSGYRCPVCGLQTEKTKHCGQRTKHTRGWILVNNDAVNWLSIAGTTTLYLLLLSLYA